MVRLLEVGGVILSLVYLKGKLSDPNLATGPFLFLFVCYLFVRICDWIHWYPGEPRGIGIEVHFRKALVPTSYILSISSIFALWNIPYLSTAVVVFAVLLMLVVAPVNGIQIYFHLRDKDPLSINYFSLNKYLHNNPCTDTSR